MALCEITACEYETRDSRVFAVATAANGSRWEYELFEGGDGKEFCSTVLERGTILTELWQQVGDPAWEEMQEEGLSAAHFQRISRRLNTPGERDYTASRFCLCGSSVPNKNKPRHRGYRGCSTFTTLAKRNTPWLTTANLPNARYEIVAGRSTAVRERLAALSLSRE